MSQLETPSFPFARNVFLQYSWEGDPAWSHYECTGVALCILERDSYTDAVSAQISLLVDIHPYIDDPRLEEAIDMSTNGQKPDLFHK